MVMTMPIIMTIENSEPIALLSFSRLPAPISWAISTCPPLENPRQTIVIKVNIWLATETAERPYEPTNCPTTIMSTNE